MIKLLATVILCGALAGITPQTCAQNSKNKFSTSKKSSKTKQKNKHRRSSEEIRVALIDLTSQFTAWDIYSDLRTYLADKSIKAILIQLQGSGDSLGSAYTLFNELKKAGTQKPIVAMIEESCLEACYYIAAGADKIVASPTASVGLIGAQVTIPRYHNVRINNEHKSADLNVTLISAGAFKTMLDPNSGELTPDQKKHVEQIAQDLYDQFCEDMAQARKLSPEHKDQWANGKHYTARRALHSEINLVDKVGSFSDATDLIKILLKERGHKADGEIVLVKKQEKGKSTSTESSE